MTPKENLSVNFYNEVWVIDHSTNIRALEGFMISVEKKELVPAHASNGTVLFNKNHHPNLIKDEQINGFGNIMIFSNSGGGQSISSTNGMVQHLKSFSTRIRIIEK